MKITYLNNLQKYGAVVTTWLSQEHVFISGLVWNYTTIHYVRRVWKRIRGDGLLKTPPLSSRESTGRQWEEEGDGVEGTRPHPLLPPLLPACGP